MNFPAGMHIIRLLSASIVMVMFFAAGATGQTQNVTDGTTPPGIAPGAPLGTYPITDIETYNPYSGEMNLRFPLSVSGGRGSAAYSSVLSIGRQKWTVDKSYDPIYGQPIYTPQDSWWSQPIEFYKAPRMLARRVSDPYGLCVPPPEVGPSYTYTLTRLTFTAPDGTEYEFRDAVTGGVKQQSSCQDGGAKFNRGTVFRTADGTAATFIASSNVYDATNLWDSNVGITGTTWLGGDLYLADGTRYHFRSEDGYVEWIRDRNGNRISFSYSVVSSVPLITNTTITDQLNRQVLIESGVTDATYGYGTRVTFRGFGGNTRFIFLTSKPLSQALRNTQPGDSSTVKTYQQLFALNGAFSNAFDPYRTTDIWLPDGRRYQLYYNVYGDVARVIFPTGGVIEYDWEGGIEGYDASGLFWGAEPFIYRRTIARRVYLTTSLSSLVNQTTYGKIQFTGWGASSSVIVRQKDDLNNVLNGDKHYYYTSPVDSLNTLDPFYYAPWNESKEKDTEALNSTDTVLRRISNTWADAPVPGGPRITETTIRLLDVSPNPVSKQTFSYDQYNNRTDVYDYDYDYGSGVAGALVRRTHIDYVTTNVVDGVTKYYDTDILIHIRNLPRRQIVYNASGGWMAQKEYEYDRYDSSAHHAPLVNRTNITGLDSGYTTSYRTRGNVTQADAWLNSGGTAIKTYAQYDIAGNVVKAIDANLNATIIDFSDRFGSPDDDARLNTAPSPNWLGGQSTFAFPTKVTNALGHEAYTQYDYFLGRPVNTEDANGVVSSLAYNDSLDRLTQAIEARYKVGSGVPSVRRQKSFVYDDTNRTITTTGDRDAFNDNILTGRAYYDGLGRTWRTAAFEGNTGAGNTWSITDTVFDALGRVRQVSNPFRATDPATATAPSGTWTTTTYDALSRVLTVQTPDTAVVTTTYSGNAVTVTDQAGKQRRSLTDALGRLIRVDEPSGCNTCLGTISSPLQPTSYSYDVFDNLRRVQQGSQNRYFMYDSLSRLIRAKNVEQAVNSSLALSDPVTGNSQWSIKYEYDANGNLWKKTDARNILTTYGYDSLNRNTSVSYNDGITAALNRYYDGAIANGKGRLHYSLSYNSHPVSGYAYSIDQVTGYDPMGRVLSRQQGFLNSAGTQWHYYPMSRTYNLAGGATSQTYPSGRSVSYGYDVAGRLSSFTGTLGDGGSRNYATGISYTAAGLMSREVFGMQSATLYHNLHYNNRQQLVDIRVGDNQNDEWNWSRGALIFYYGTAARDSWNAFANSPDNNGNVLRQVNYVPLIGGGYVHPQLDDYIYDELNRIDSVTEAQLDSGGNWTFNLFKQNFDYDRWGNRTVWCSPCQPGVTNDTFTIDTATNRITAKNGYAMTYDPAGNQSNDVTGSRWFDGENKMYKAQQGGTISHYVYDADSRRVRRIVGTTETWQVYGMEGELIAEYNVNGSPSSPQKEYGYRGGQMLIMAQTSPLEVRWLVTDHLGTPRMNIRGTGSDGGSLTSVTRHDYLPFGEELIAGIRRNGGNGQYGYEPPPDGVRQKFDAYERDNESGLDFAEARYFSSTQGRFTSHDPESEEEATRTPQSWNGYSYVINNPLKLKDPDGRKYKICSPDGKECHSVDDDNFYRARKVGKGDGYSFSGSGDFYEKGELRDKDGKLIATYQQVSIDDPTREFIYQMRERAPATKQAIGLFAGGGGLIGTGVGGAMYLGGVAFGSGVTTLGLSGGATSAEASAAAAAGEAVEAVGGKITGYTKHGLNQAISRDGLGVSPRAILDAVKNPLRSIPQSNGAIKYVGEKATVILNQAGKVISTWARSSAGTRIPR